MNSYYAICTLINVLIFSGWVWLSVLYFDKRKTWHRYGCICMAVSWLLAGSYNYMVDKLTDHILPELVMNLRYVGLVLALSATIAFIYNYYHSRVLVES